jgi:cellulose synthase operon protein C
MRRRAGVCACLMLSLAACSVLDHKNDAPTLKTLESRRVTVTRDTTLSATPEQAQQAYQQFLQAAPKSPQRGEALRRLADITLENGGAHDELPAVASDTGAAADSAQAAAAIHLYEQVLAANPDAADNDRVLYQLARAYEQSGRLPETLRTLEHLVAAYPASPYRAEAQFRRGEILFVQQQYAAAQQAYQAVLDAGPKGQFYSRALYKRGWASFKQSDADGALDSFLAFLDRTLGKGQTTATLSRGEQELLNDTLRATSLTLSYEERPQALAELFARKGARPYEYLVYQNLGDLYLSKERYTDAASVYRDYALSHDSDARAPQFQIQAIDAYRKGKLNALVLAGKQEYVQRYALDGAYWHTHTPQQQPAALAYLQESLVDLAAYYHAQAQSKHDSADYQQAAQWYRQYLKSFPKDARAPHLNFLLAELLNETHQYPQAVQEYQRTAYDYGDHPQAAEAGYAALVAARQYRGQLNGAARAQWDQDDIAMALRFAEHFPRHPQAAAVQSKAAEDLYAAHDLPRAAATAQAVLARTPAADAALRRTASIVLGHVQFERGDFAAAESAYQNALQLTAPNDPERAVITPRLAAAIYKQGDRQRNSGKPAEAVGTLLRVAQIAPGSEIAASADYDAAAALLAAHDWNGAIRVLEHFRSAYPKHPLQGEVTRKLAAAYSESGQAGRAATELETVSRSVPGAQLQQQALWEAAQMYEKAHQPDQAASAYRQYIQRFPKPLTQQLEAHRWLAQRAAKSGDAVQQRHWLQALIDAERAGGTERSDTTARYAAIAALAMAEPAQTEYAQIALSAPLNKNLKRKKDAMQAALKAYETAAEYGITEVTTQATYAIAELYRDFGRALMESERPANLSALERAQYDTLVEEQAFPFEEKAIAIHETNVKRTTDGVYDQWVQKSFTQLAELVPAKYGKQEHGAEFVDALP